MSYKDRLNRQIDPNLLTGVYCALDGTSLSNWTELCLHLETVHNRVYSDWFYNSVKREVDDVIAGDWSSLYRSWLNTEPCVKRGESHG